MQLFSNDQSYDLMAGLKDDLICLCCKYICCLYFRDHICAVLLEFNAFSMHTTNMMTVA